MWGWAPEYIDIAAWIGRFVISVFKELIDFHFALTEFIKYSIWDHCTRYSDISLCHNILWLYHLHRNKKILKLISSDTNSDKLHEWIRILAIKSWHLSRRMMLHPKACRLPLLLLSLKGQGRKQLLKSRVKQCWEKELPDMTCWFFKILTQYPCRKVINTPTLLFPLFSAPL